MGNSLFKKSSILLLSAILVGGCGTSSEETVETEEPTMEEATPAAEQETEAPASEDTTTEEPAEQTEPTEPAETPAPSEEPAEEAESSAPVGKVESSPTITKAEFDQIENGMTYEEVVQIIGGEGEVLSEVGEKGTDFYTVMYTYDGEGGIGANANFTFQNNQLQAKAQIGLE